MINIFVGYDKQETIAYHVLVQSLINNTSIPFRVTPIIKDQLVEYKRVRTEIESTDFSLTRFCVPWMSEYSGWSLFVDCDFVFTDDLKKLWDLRDDRYSVMVCKHEYEPKVTRKFSGNIQTVYKRKNWSSLMLFNNSKCKILTPDYINSTSGKKLHQFAWLDDSSIGEIDKSWNYLVGESHQSDKAIGIHFTNGGPWFEHSYETEYAKEWLSFKNKAFAPASFPNRFFLINGDEYELVKPIFKGNKSHKPLLRETDYYQLVRQRDKKVFHLKQKHGTHRGFKQDIPYVYTQYMGTRLAMFFGFKTQEVQIFNAYDNKFLLTADIRGDDGHLEMEPIAFLSKRIRIENNERDIEVLYKGLYNVAGGDVASFLTRIFLFDYLLGNNQRDGQSLRVNTYLYDDVESKYHDILIENNLGSFFFSEDKRPMYDIAEIKRFIVKHETFKTAIDFFEKMSPAILEDIILGIDGDLIEAKIKDKALAIIMGQYEKLLVLEDEIFSMTS